MKIREILEQYEITPNEGVINMGIMNGWTINLSTAYRELRKLSIPGTSSNRELGRCYMENSCDITDGEETFTLKYSVDSSD